MYILENQLLDTKCLLLHSQLDLKMIEFVLHLHISLQNYDTQH